MGKLSFRKSRACEKDPLLGPSFESKPKWYRSRTVWLLLLFVAFFVGIAVFKLHELLNKSIENKLQATRLMSIATVNEEYLQKCAPQVTCDPNSKYRTINGSCNNVQNPTWGASMTPFYRYMDPVFSDGISKFRVQSDGSPLPNARTLTLTLFQNTSRVCDHKNNELLVPWGQFITHDVAFSPVNSVNSSFPDSLNHCLDVNPPADCEAIIKLFPDDPTYKNYNMTILKFMRLVTSANYSCPLAPVTVLDQNTHFIDASNVYGSNDKLANELRMYNGGKLKSNKIKNEEYCPQDPSKLPKNGNAGVIAFVAGDVNVNQNVAVGLFQNMYLRFHNYIAKKLQELHPTWADETVYQETRRIVGATVQIITYEQFLPIVLGEQYMQDYGLTNPTNYDPTLIVSVAQEFTSGAFRLLHNIVPAQLNFVSSNYTIYEVEEPSKLFLRPDSLIGNVDGLLRGLMETPGRESQSSYNDLITNIVIQLPSDSKTTNVTGFDLLSYDIQRGRDVGLPPYNKMRKLCGLSEAESFDDLSNHIPSEKIDLLKTFYSTVDDVDYYVGILLENKHNGSMVGPTGSCVIADSFYRFRNGDRFFYDVQNQPGSFTTDQINALRNITLSHIICVTSHLEHVQTDTFSLVDHIRLMKLKPSCDTYKIDLAAW
ncbi:Haem peroxidase,Haem peroxidase, animal type [Cinara cedri]|uniref:Haem peroxidase,Haem peroxidase, animal type n=1 Tax=Cinara cedri TaxID=506608 RepID=A0A5E4MR00_9HEMI|nr:Haem peroxidase,Haem peroxidase, animal type [Cinara cedri]